MNDNLNVLTWHGWGFDRSCWDCWEQQLSETFTFNKYDRGYRGSPQPVNVNGADNFSIILTHSFGLHLCPDEQLSNADLLVIFGGFREFHPVAAQFKRRSRLVLNNMLQQLQENPQKVLTEFMSNTYKPADPPAINVDEFDIENLYHDLQALNRSSLPIEPLKKARKVCILHGSEDAIVPRVKGRDLYEILQQNASYFELKEAGHALPFTHTEQCWAFIEPELHELLHTEHN